MKYIEFCKNWVILNNMKSVKMNYSVYDSVKHEVIFRSKTKDEILSHFSKLNNVNNLQNLNVYFYDVDNFILIFLLKEELRKYKLSNI